MSEFHNPVDSFQDFQAAVESSQNIFNRPALKNLYDFFTTGNDSEGSWIKPRQILSGNRHETWRTIHMGASCAIHSVQQEFKRKAGSAKGAPEYIHSLHNGDCLTQMLISVKGFHYPLNQSVVATTPGPSPSNQCYFSIY